MNVNPSSILLKEYNYPLSQSQIAAFPLDERDSSRLLVYKSGKISDDTFKNIASHLPENATPILNDTRVIEARIRFKKPTGGTVEIFCLEPYGDSIETAMHKKGIAQWNCLIGGASKWKPGQLLQKEIWIESLPVVLSARYLQKNQESFVIEFNWKPLHFPFADIIHAAGAIPLPPYIKRAATERDAERYQTIFARHQGSVAAPTAALHFTSAVFEQLKGKNITTHYITLHVGAGTFKPVKGETIDQHQMHSEHFIVTASTLQILLQADPVIAVGTTSLRTLESLHWIGVKLIQEPNLPVTTLTLSQWEAYELQNYNVTYKNSLQALLDKMQRLQIEQLFCETSLLIVPGYSFQIPVGLITNFHQPQSTLLLLVAAFIGDDWKMVYDHALQHNYRFLSYGDSSLLWAKK